MKILQRMRAIRKLPVRPALKDASTASARGDELPADLVAAIDACSVGQRSDGEDGTPRVIIPFEGRRGGWIHGISANRAALASRCPGQSEAQFVRAMRFPYSSVAIRLQVPRRRRKRIDFVNSWRKHNSHA